MPIVPYGKQAKERARELRNAMTPQEKKLWYQFLRAISPRFLRQKPLGPYIADFYCPTGKLVIELDGSQHHTDEGQERDGWRSGLLSEMGLRVLRFSNREIDHDFENVCQMIMQELNKKEGTP